jgi:hypothetical protein
LETWRNQNLQTCTKGFADYGYNTKSVFLMKKQYVLCRFEGAQETPTIIRHFVDKVADKRI